MPPALQLGCRCLMHWFLLRTGICFVWKTLLPVRLLFPTLGHTPAGEVLLYLLTYLPHSVIILMNIISYLPVDLPPENPHFFRIVLYPYPALCPVHGESSFVKIRVVSSLSIRSVTFYFTLHLYGRSRPATFNSSSFCCCKISFFSLFITTLVIGHWSIVIGHWLRVFLLMTSTE